MIELFIATFADAAPGGLNDPAQWAYTLGLKLILQTLGLAVALVMGLLLTRPHRVRRHVFTSELNVKENARCQLLTGLAKWISPGSGDTALTRENQRCVGWYWAIWLVAPWLLIAEGVDLVVASYVIFGVLGVVFMGVLKLQRHGVKFCPDCKAGQSH